ncbi:hypothetical protein Riv7116_2993 [Rivularia sp. PCC 7116]|uniref:DUF6163 family protein n=1 Tax=Rivularia sp. PCC 7116 TaxID=373994 RepID=UPI00029F16DB|nr:DUF6163 family protein [Rivularia sp. PCC 7116]AFY55474.1 hypothetical protein Riv7116_2993 [Rivularia sp. PCC 7116]
MNLLFESRHKPSMGIYLKILALFYFYGATVHYANLLGFGEIPFRESPLSWQVGDIFYAILGTFTVIGLWLKTRWGIVCFLLSAVSQLILYIGFPQWFAFTNEQQQLLWSMVMFHVVTLLIFFGLLLFTRSREQYNS